VYEDWKKFKAETDAWFGLNELTMETILFSKK
jgi:hypothetical protein